MTSREKVVAAINHRPYAGLAIDFGAMRSTGINAIAYANLAQSLGMDEKPCVYDVMQQIADPSEQMRTYLGGDVRQVHRVSPVFGVHIDRFKEGTLTNGQPAMVPWDFNPVQNAKGDFELRDSTGTLVARRAPDGNYYDLAQTLFADLETVEDAAQIYWPVMEEWELAFVEEQARRLYQTTDKALLLDFGGSIFEQGQQHFGFEKYYCDLAANKELIHAYHEKLTETYLQNLQNLLPHVAQYINVIMFGDDLGTQVSTQISVEMYREMIMPYHKRMYRYVQEHFPNVKVFLHSCGAISPLLPSLIEAGVQILNPVQISAAGMDPRKLKERFGKELVFWGGGADLQMFVREHTVEEVRTHVRELIEIFNSDHTGFVFTTVHNIQYDIPPEKILAIYEEARSYQ